MTLVIPIYVAVVLIYKSILSILCDSMPISCNLLNVSFYVLGVFRWHSSDVKNVIQNLSQILSQIKCKDVICSGDFNINVKLDCGETDDYLNSMSSLGFQQLIDIDTRVQCN